MHHWIKYICGEGSSIFPHIQNPYYKTKWLVIEMTQRANVSFIKNKKKEWETSTYNLAIL